MHRVASKWRKRNTNRDSAGEEHECGVQYISSCVVAHGIRAVAQTKDKAVDSSEKSKAQRFIGLLCHYEWGSQCCLAKNKCMHQDTWLGVGLGQGKFMANSWWQQRLAAPPAGTAGQSCTGMQPAGLHALWSAKGAVGVGRAQLALTVLPIAGALCSTAVREGRREGTGEWAGMRAECRLYAQAARDAADRLAGQQACMPDMRRQAKLPVLASLFENSQKLGKRSAC